MFTSLAAAALGVSLLGACAESLTERAVDFGLEQAVEGDEDIDFSFEDDGFTIQTEEGALTVESGANGGTAVFSGQDGEGTLSFDENGVVIDGDEGDGVVTFTDEGGLAFTDENGSSIIGATEVPADWPAVLGVPASAVAGQSFFSVFDDGATVTTTGGFQHDPAEPYAQEVAARLAADGWTATSDLSQAGSVYSEWSKGSDTVLLIGDPTGFTSVILTQA